MTKKVIALFLVAVMAFALAACGKKAEETSSDTVSTVAVSKANGTVSEQAKSNDKDKNKSKGNAGKKGAKDKKADEATAGNGDKGTDGGSAGGAKVVSPKKMVKAKQSKKTIRSAQEVSIGSGKSVSKNVNLKGKNITIAITQEGQYNTDSYKRAVKAFEKQYGCKVTLKTLNFDKYNQQVSQAIAAGKCYDICYCHGSMFPACAIDGLYEDLTKYIREGDLMNDSDPSAGGIDSAKTSYFKYKGKIYGCCSYDAAFPYVLYYNKLQMDSAGFGGTKDPRYLAERGKWTWKTIEKYGKALTKAEDDQYFLHSSFATRGITLAYGAPTVVVNNGVYAQNVTSAGYITALNKVRELFVGNKQIAEPLDTKHPYHNYGTLLKGKSYLFFEESSKFLDLSKDVKSSTAFDRKKDNIGIVECPFGETNKGKQYPTGWLTAICCGKGKDPRVAVAWQDFYSAYNDKVQDSNAMNATDTKYVEGLLKGNICCEVGSFKTSDTDTEGLRREAIQKICYGADVSKETTAIKSQVTACIKFTLNKK